MRKGGKNLEDDLYEDEDYYDEDDDYYQDDYVAKPEINHPKPSKNDEAIGFKKKKNKKNKSNKSNNNNNNNNDKKLENSSPQKSSKNQSSITATSTNNNNNKDESKEAKSPIGRRKSSTQSDDAKISKGSRKKSTDITPADLNKIKYPKIEYKIGSEDQNNLSDISIVVIGHVDSGKSTLMGHLLYSLGKVDKKIIQGERGINKKTGSSNLKFAWATDESTDERKHGVTVDIAYKNFQTQTKNVNVMDAPGHRDFIPNMITGTSAADAAILVVDSGKSAFDAGFFQGGQTKEHAILAKTLGVKQIIVCVNKLELFNWNKERYTYIENNVKDFLLNIGFEENDIFFIPISGLYGENLTEHFTVQEAQWYEGKNLIELIDSLDSPIRNRDAPVRFEITDFSFSTVNNLQGHTLFGKLETGVLLEKVDYLISPINLKVKIRSMSVNKEKVNYVLAGQTAEILLNLDKNSNEVIEQGFVLSSVDFPVPVVKSFKAQIKTLDLKCPISLGQKMFLHLQGQKVQIKIKKILKIFNEDSTTVKNNSIFIPKNFNAVIICECDEKICAELYNNIKQLGRIALRADGVTIGIGFIQEFV